MKAFHKPLKYWDLDDVGSVVLLAYVADIIVVGILLVILNDPLAGLVAKVHYLVTVAVLAFMVYLMHAFNKADKVEKGLRGD